MEIERIRQRAGSRKIEDNAFLGFIGTVWPVRSPLLRWSELSNHSGSNDMGWTSQDALIDDVTNNGQFQYNIRFKTISTAQVAAFWTNLGVFGGSEPASAYAGTSLTFFRQTTHGPMARGSMAATSRP
jgi:hypothetical protein